MFSSAITLALAKPRSLCGVAKTTSASSIKKCAIGQIGAPKFDYIITETVEKNSTIEENIYVANIKKSSNEKHGTAVAAARFNQRYFEYTLGWDFEKIWVWDSNNNRPALRQVGVNATISDEFAASKPIASGKKTVAASDKNTVDLLTQQVRANIWL